MDDDFPCLTINATRVVLNSWIHEPGADSVDRARAVVRMRKAEEKGEREEIAAARECFFARAGEDRAREMIAEIRTYEDVVEAFCACGNLFVRERHKLARIREPKEKVIAWTLEADVERREAMIDEVYRAYSDESDDLVGSLKRLFREMGGELVAELIGAEMAAKYFD